MLACLLAIVLAWALTGCSAPVRPDLPTSTPSPAVVTLPADGLSLEAMGFHNGPVDAFSLPRTVVVTTSVDQPSGVTVVLADPSASALARYLLKTLPTTGFVVTRQDERTASLEFTGYGWHGSFTGTGDSSAVILRP